MSSVPVQRRLWIIFLTFFLPLYFLRLYSLPLYQIPEEEKIKVRGKISRQPYLKDSQQIIYLGSINIITGRFPGYFYGQEIEVIGKFRKRVINPFQPQYFSYFPSIRVLPSKEDENKKFNIRRILLKIRGRIERVIEGFFPEPQSSLLLGILLGAKRQMPPKFWQDLRKTGTLHIVVASGQNVAMVARFLVSLLVLVVSRRRAIWLALLGVGLYVLMVGAEAPVVRAGVMAGIAFLAQFFGREEEGTIALVVAAVIMLLISPLMLFDIGFQLSFAATAGLIWIYPVLSVGGLAELERDATNFSLMSARKDKKLPLDKLGVLQHRFARNYRLALFHGAGHIFSLPILGGALATTVAAQLAVMPIILINFGQISWLSPLINGLVLWVVPLVMLLGSITTALALIIKPLAQMLGWFVWLLLTYFVKIIEWSGSISWVSWELGKISGWWAVGYYLILVWIIVKVKRKQQELR